VGGDEGEGGPNYFVHPHPHPPPSKGGGGIFRKFQILEFGNDLPNVQSLRYGHLFFISTCFDSIRPLDKSLQGDEIVPEANPHDVIMGSRRNDEKFLLLGAKVLI